MIKELTEKEYQQLYGILIEKLSYIISNRRNLFNFAFLDEVEENIKEMIKTRNFVIFRDYDNIYQVIDNFESNVGDYVDRRLKELGDD